ncbi:hypothetical protein B0H10DRAFT_1953437 [Mycena sp. CBHHK59/15]|nr:hypothetical protein B0H10DRAFT_1953437 [Mycena sp. CBHHK59/15]
MGEQIAKLDTGSHYCYQFRAAVAAVGSVALNCEKYEVYGAKASHGSKLPGSSPASTSAVAIVLFFVAVLASVANASMLSLSAKFPHDGVDYTGPAIPDIAAFSSTSITVPTGCIWRGALLDDRVDFDSPNIGGQTDYDISNIQGFSVVRIRFLAFTFAQVDVSSRNKFSTQWVPCRYMYECGLPLWPESDMESDDYFEAWEVQPKLQTYDKCEERWLEKREKHCQAPCC